jgi:metal-responsive CopG/Arc/MetJ family transcriptional regulator
LNSVQRTVRIPKNLDDEINVIMAEEVKTRPRMKRSNIITMLLNLGIEQYLEKHLAEEV